MDPVGAVELQPLDCAATTDATGPRGRAAEPGRVDSTYAYMYRTDNINTVGATSYKERKQEESEFNLFTIRPDRLETSSELPRNEKAEASLHFFPTSNSRLIILISTFLSKRPDSFCIQRYFHKTKTQPIQS